jgi:hypothetical protein
VEEPVVTCTQLNGDNSNKLTFWSIKRHVSRMSSPLTRLNMTDPGHSWSRSESGPVIYSLTLDLINTKDYPRMCKYLTDLIGPPTPSRHQYVCVNISLT